MRTLTRTLRKCLPAVGIGVAAAGVAVLIAAFVLFAVPEKQLSPSELRAASLSDLKTLGGSLAYLRFKQRVANESPSEAHGATHVFGAQLYDVIGYSGISACDSTLSYGCYHGFLAEAVSSEGIESIEPLDAACAKTKSPVACSHGLGHGLVEYLGQERLVDALNACLPAHPPDRLAGCASGVFMEYNVPFIDGADGSITNQARPMKDASRPYDPCPLLAEQFQPACYLNLPQWWQDIYDGDFAKMGVLCQAIESIPFRRTCILGLGNIVANASFLDADRASELCGRLPDEASVSRCRAVGAGVFKTNGFAGAARKLCVQALPDDRIICER